jgi:hypothetical protein
MTDKLCYKEVVVVVVVVVVVAKHNCKIVLLT